MIKRLGAYNHKVDKWLIDEELHQERAIAVEQRQVMKEYEERKLDVRYFSMLEQSSNQKPSTLA
jgi:hypothetical protein